MAQYKDTLPSPQGWIHDLARLEIYPEEEGLGFTKAADPTQMIEEATVEFLTELRGIFQEQTKVFNSYSEQNSKFPEVKIYSVAQSSSDFMIFRNQVKLVISNVSHGVVQFVFTQHVRSNVFVDTLPQSTQTLKPPQEIMAQMGPFREITWTFQGEKITAEAVAKYYFSEFVQITRDSRKLKGGANDALLKQIKALIQREGLEL